MSSNEEPPTISPDLPDCACPPSLRSFTPAVFLFQEALPDTSVLIPIPQEGKLDELFGSAWVRAPHI